MQKEVLIGTLLGDASIPMFQGKSRLRVELQGKTIYGIYMTFFRSPTLLARLHKYGIFLVVAPGAQDRQSVWFWTYGHPEFKFYDQLFYPAHDPEGSRKKRVAESISELLTARALAYWLMDDWASTSKKSRSRTYRFSTHSFPLDDQKRLVEALRDNFDIAATIQKQRSHYIFVKNLLSVNLIRIHPCFYYKIHRCKNN